MRGFLNPDSLEGIFSTTMEEITAAAATNSTLTAEWVSLGTALSKEIAVFTIVSIVWGYQGLPTREIYKRIVKSSR